MWQKGLILLACLALLGVGAAWDDLFGTSTAKPRAAVSPTAAPKRATVAKAPTTKAVTVAVEKATGTAFFYEYVPPNDPSLQPAYALVHDGDLLRKLPEIQAIDGMLLLPKPIRYVTAECKSVDAFYSPDKGEVVLCYETVQVLQQQGRTVAEANQAGGDFARRYLQANLRFIALHETGHALIDLLDLPITGREEDAVDQLATTLMQKFASIDDSPQQVAENLRMAGTWFIARSKGQYDLDSYADEHSLGEQRYFNLQCLIYGSNPAQYLSIVTDGDLPPARAQRCPREAKRVYQSWLRLLLPHAAPKYQMSVEDATKRFDELERKREKNAESLYVR